MVIGSVKQSPSRQTGRKSRVLRPLNTVRRLSAPFPLAPKPSGLRPARRSVLGEIVSGEIVSGEVGVCRVAWGTPVEGMSRRHGDVPVSQAG